MPGDNVCDQEARDLARDAMAHISSHEAVCAERWNQSRSASQRVESAIATANSAIAGVQKALSNRMGFTPVSLLTAAAAVIGFLAERAVHW